MSLNYQSLARSFVAALCLCISAAAQNTVKLSVSAMAPATKEARADVTNVVAWLMPLDGSAQQQPLKPEVATLTQRGKQFHPHLLVLPAGSSVDFHNQDPVFHNVFSLFNGKRFDLGLYEAGESRRVKFDRAGISYIFCNIHPQMSAIIITVRTPYFGVSDSGGTIVVNNVPSGEYQLHVFAEGLDTDQMQKLIRNISVPSATASVTVSLPSRTTELSHKNKYGRDYDQPSGDPYEK